MFSVKHLKHSPILCLFLLLSPIWLCRSIGAEPLFINYTSGNRLNCLALGDGHVWLGAQGGLVRFNPQNQQRVKFTPADWRGTCCVAEVVIDSRGVLWASHEDLIGNHEPGVVEFDGVQWQWHEALPEPGVPAKIYGLAADELGYVWFLYGGYVVRFDGTAWHSWRPYEIVREPMVGIAARRGRGWGVGCNTVCMFEAFDASCTGTIPEYGGWRHVAADRDERVWFTTCSRYLVYYDGQSFTTFNLPVSDEWAYVTLLRIDDKNTKWVFGRIYGDWDNQGDAASLSQDGVWQVYRNVWPYILGIDRFSDLRFDATGAAWTIPGFVLTDQDEEQQPFLIRYDGQGLESFWAFDPVVGTIVEQLCIDTSGSVWFTSSRTWYALPRYLTRWLGGDSEILWPGERELPDRINSIAAAPNGEIWFGTDEGAYRFDGQEWDRYLTGERVSKVKIGPDGQVLGICYVSDYARVVKRFDGTNWETEYEPDWSGQEITDVALDSKGVLWVSCGNDIYYGTPYNYAGIRSWDGDNEGKYETGCAYRGIAVDQNDVVWAPRGWICKIESGSVSRLWSDDLGGYSTGAPLFADSHNRKWCKAYQSVHSRYGLLCIDENEEVRFYSTSDGLCSGEINDIDEDPYGNIWVSTGRGISVLLEESSFELDANVVVDDQIPATLNASTSVSYPGPQTSADVYAALQAPSGQLFYVAGQEAAPPFPIFYAAFAGSTEFLEPGPDYEGPGSIPNTPDMKDLAPPPLPLPDPPDGQGPTGLALFAYPVPYFANVPLPAYGSIENLVLLNTELPEEAPTGTYTFHVGITAPSSISNLYRTAQTTFGVSAE